MSTATDTLTDSTVKTKSTRPKRQIAAQIKDLIKAKPTKISDLVKGGGKKQKLPFAATLGCDPECHLVDNDTGQIVSAIPVLQRDKHNPIDLGDGARAYFDNVLVEFGIAPSNTKEEMLERLKVALTRLHEHLGPRYSLLPRAGHVYSDAELAPSDLGNPWEIGCCPSVDCYREALVAPSAFPSNLRTGSFHIHVGNRDWQGEHDGRLLDYNSRHDMIKLLDVFVGLGSVLYDLDDTTPERRKLYGAAGSLRVTPYGCEYRVLSPGPLKSREMTNLTLDLTNHAISHIANRTEKDVLRLTDSAKVELAINTCDVALAESILTDVKLPADLMTRVKQTYPDVGIREGWGL